MDLFQKHLNLFFKLIKPQAINTVAVAYIKKQKKLLLVKQKNYDFWSPPGGLIEFGETSSLAAKREVKEETGLEIKTTTSLPETIHYHQATKRQIIIFNWQAELTNPQQNARLIDNQDSGDLTNFKWVTLAEINNYPCFPGVSEICNQLLANEK